MMATPQSTAPASDVDLWSTETLQDPWETYAELRSLGPVVWLERVGLHALTRYDVVRSALQDWRTFSSARGVMITDEMNARAGNGVIMSDPPDHDRRRKILNKQLVPRRLAEREAFVVERAHQIVEQVVSRGTIEAVHDLGAAVSVAVVGDLVGLPDEGRDQLVQWAYDGFNLWGPADERYERAKPGFRALLDYSEQVAIPGRLTPDGWGAEIYGAGEADDVRPDERPGIIFGYLHAGMDTTVSSVSSALLLFGQHSDAWEAVRADRSLLAGAVNEAIRLYSPVQRYTRVTTAPTSIGGVDIPADSRVLILIGSANRDGHRFVDPDRFDITRPPTEHIGFGFGVHHCAGAALARTEMLALFNALADRVARFELGTHEWGVNAALHGLARLDVTFHPA